jgi:hypothetical protein
MLKRIGTTVGVAMFLIAMAGTQASAQPGTSTKLSGTLSAQLSLFDRCLGEWIPMNVTIVDSATMVDNGQTSRVQEHLDIRGSGTGSLSGTDYSLQSVEDVSGDVAADAAGNYNVTIEADVVLISHGSAPKNSSTL